MHHPMKWEFPGGKVEPGETEEECIKRELAEELQMNIHILTRLPSFYHTYPDFSIELIPFLCQLLEGGHTALEHNSTGWFSLPELLTLDWAEADKALMKYVVRNML
jgi:8-oxo-dGTP diphosphatase